MTRRIIYILLAVVVVLAVVLGIRWWLNRDTGEETITEEAAGVVEDITAEIPIEETAPEGDTGAVAPAEEGTIVTTITEETAPAGDQSQPAVTEGEAAVTEGETAAPEGGDMAAETGATDAAAPEGSTDGSQESITVDPSLGGVPESGDANVGGGVVEPGLADTSGGAAATEAPATEAPATEAPATEAPATGGQVGIVPPIANLVVPGQPVQHIVQNKEWLTQLARCYGTTVQDIQAANNYSCPDLIHPGWVVNINNPGNAGPITINEIPCFTYYTVQQGDNLYRIAEEFGIHFQWLARINAVYNYDYIQVGQVLVIPNPVPPEMTSAPAQPFYYSNCWYAGCWDYGYGGYWQPQPVPYGW